MPSPTDIRPPFTHESALAKVKAAEDTWNTRDPERVALAYTEDTAWRNRGEFLQGRTAVRAFLRRKWEKELDYHLMKELWAFTDNRISVRFEYEWRDGASQWYRSYGNEHWEFDANGLMRRRDASVNDVSIQEHERRYRRGLQASVTNTGSEVRDNVTCPLTALRQRTDCRIHRIGMGVLSDREVQKQTPATLGHGRLPLSRREAPPTGGKTF